MLIFFVWIRSSFQTSIFFQHLKPLGFYLVCFYQALVLVRSQELARTDHNQVLLNLFSLLVDAAVLPLQSQPTENPHRTKCRDFEHSTPGKS